MQKLKDAFNWLIVDKIRLILIFVVVGFIIGVGTKSNEFVDKVSSIHEAKIIEKEVINIIQDKKLDEVKTKDQSCSPSEAKIVLSDELIQKKMNLFMMDFNSARVKGYDLTTDYFTKEKIFGVKRELVANDFQVYIMLYEKIDKLERNKDEYEKYMKKQSKEFIKVED